jgi:hypothetical protein
MQTLDQIKAEFYGYLEQRFESGLTDLVAPPAGVKIGERVLYQLVDGEEAQRADIEKQNQDFEKNMAELVEKMSSETGTKPEFYTDPMISSGLPYPRAIDVPYVSEFCMGSLATDYAASHDEFPTKDFPIRWLFGVVFGYSAKTLLYMDFTDPKVRALYVANYDAEHELLAGKDIPQEFKAFIVQQAMMKHIYSPREEVHWIKIVQTNGAVQLTQSTKNGVQHEIIKGGEHEHK